MSQSLRLRIRNAEATGLEEEIREFSGPAIFGRSRDVDVLLLDPGISRRHASLRPGDDGGWSIEDLHSTRGTWVNGRRLAPGETTAIAEGDLVEINPWSLLVLYDTRVPGYGCIIQYLVWYSTYSMTYSMTL